MLSLYGGRASAAKAGGKPFPGTKHWICWPASSGASSIGMARKGSLSPRGPPRAWISSSCCGWPTSTPRPTATPLPPTYPIRIQFAPGHRLRVDISSSNFPRFDVNPNTGEPVGRHTHTVPALNVVYMDQQRPSHIVLPVIPPNRSWHAPGSPKSAEGIPHSGLLPEPSFLPRVHPMNLPERPAHP